jgi:hypothetical protein
MASLRIDKLVTMLVAVAVVSASLLVAAEPANAVTALFRAKRAWWFSQAGSWTDGAVIPTTTLPSAQARIGGVSGGVNPNKSFTAPEAFIKNTTYTFMCGPGTFMCYLGYPKSSGWYSYWNAKGSFQSQNPNAPTTTTTVRQRTVSDDYKASLMGWASHTVTVMTPGPPAGTILVTVPTHPPTAHYTLITPTEGGCTGVLTGTNPDCPGTTQFNGNYTASRGGSIMVTPGSNRFGGTMRFFDGPNGRDYQLITLITPYYTTVSWPRTPTSQQNAATKGPMVVGSVTGSVLPGYRFRLTNPYRIDRLIIGTTTMGGPKYYTKQAKYLITRAPYTTGMMQAWDPNGNTSTFQSSTGYDNRTPGGLNGTISMVHPRLVHTYLTARSTDPTTPIAMSWSSARSRRINFTFAPEPAGVAMLAAGFATLAGLVRLRRR